MKYLLEKLRKLDALLHTGQIRTSRGWMPPSKLHKLITVAEGAEATITATEYWLGDELVHRSIKADLKGRDLSDYRGALS